MSELSEDSIARETQGKAVERSRVIAVPQLCLVALIGATSSGKSTFAARHFAPTETLSSDTYRALVGDDPNDQSVTGPAFDALHYVAAARLKLGRLTVIDATNVKPQDRASLVRLARDYDVFPVAIVFDIDERILLERNAKRTDRNLKDQVIHRHTQDLRRNLRGLEREGFRQISILRSPEAVDSATVERTPMWPDKRGERGPFDIIGDVHGCYDELLTLFGALGYQPDEQAGMRHPDGRRVIFVGDLVDRGPKVVEVVNLAQRMVAAGQAFCVPGNHDMKLARQLAGRQVQITHGLAESLAQIDALAPEARNQWSRDYQSFADNLVSHLILDGGALVVAHAGMKQEYQGRASGRVREFALFGETTGETDEFGLPVRANWAADYRGHATVVYGHTPVPEANWLNNTINIDTGCVFGGKLTALRWPEREAVSVPALKTWAEPVRPLDTGATASSTPASVEVDTLLRIEDVLGKQIITTRLAGSVIVEQDRAAAALEVISRFATDPRWIIYLPPTMAPSETSTRANWLEYPSEAFSYYRSQGAPRVLCEEKHMGSRAALVICRDSAAASRRFGVPADGAPGACYTRTGRRFLDDEKLNQAFIERVSAALSAADFWDRHETDWVCLDAEIMPWNAKAQGLLREQYAPVGSAGQTAVESALVVARQGAARGLELGALVTQLERSERNISRYTEAYGRYCWNVNGLDGLRVAPFHLLATEGHVHTDRTHQWHMEELARLAEVDSLFVATRRREVNTLDRDDCALAEAWWEELTDSGAEGIVVKPMDFITRGSRGLAQPALKCRGREYLRIIYGPDYDEPANVERLRKRGLATKRSLAVREFALGIEALERFTRREPLWRTHQAVFGVLAMESEPVDPRL